MARFLLATDDARTRIGIAHALERAGHTADIVTHPKLASERADLHGVDAVLVALQQPMQREQFIIRLRARNQEIPVVMLLDSLSVWQERRLKANDSVVLRQPVGTSQVVARLEDLAGES